MEKALGEIQISQSGKVQPRWYFNGRIAPCENYLDGVARVNVTASRVQWIDLPDGYFGSFTRHPCVVRSD